MMPVGILRAMEVGAAVGVDAMLAWNSDQEEIVVVEVMGPEMGRYCEVSDVFAVSSDSAPRRVSYVTLFAKSGPAAFLGSSSRVLDGP